MGRTLRSRGKYFLNEQYSWHLLIVDALLWGVRCVLAGSLFLNRQSSGHLLIVDAVLWDVRCVPEGSIFRIDTPWGISSWRTLCCGTYAAFPRDVFSE